MLGENFDKRYEIKLVRELKEKKTKKKGKTAKTQL